LSRPRRVESTCTARADALRVQRRTAGLVPNWLKDPASATLHPAATPRQVDAATPQTLGPGRHRNARSDCALRGMARAVPFDLPVDSVRSQSGCASTIPRINCGTASFTPRSERAPHRLRSEPASDAGCAGGTELKLQSGACCVGVSDAASSTRCASRIRALALSPCGIAHPVSGIVSAGSGSAVPGPVLSGCGRPRPAQSGSALC
jgi:hypothetical protein